MTTRRSFITAAAAGMAGMMFTQVRLLAAEQRGRKLSEADMAFIMKAGEGGDAEVALGKLAEANGSSTEVKAFGKRMVDDHTEANGKLIAIAKAKDVQLSHELKGEMKEMYEQLAKLNGPEFDKHYIQHMVKDHEEDVALFKKEAENGEDSKLKEFAGKTLKVIEQHLALAKEIAPKIGAGAAT
jgi:putative membrane protein